MDSQTDPHTVRQAGRQPTERRALVKQGGSDSRAGLEGSVQHLLECFALRGLFVSMRRVAEDTGVKPSVALLYRDISAAAAADRR